MAKTSSSTTQVQLPESLERYSADLLNQAKAVSTIAPTPYTGATVAGLTPAQEASMLNTGQAATAFGMASPFASSAFNAVTGEPVPQSAYGQSLAASGRSPFTGMTTEAADFGGGAVGYSPYAGYAAAINAIPEAQRNAIMSFFIDPNTGALPSYLVGGASNGGPYLSYGDSNPSSDSNHREIMDRHWDRVNNMTTADTSRTLHNDPAGTVVSRFFNDLGWDGLANATDLTRGPVDYSLNSPTVRPTGPSSAGGRY